MSFADSVQLKIDIKTKPVGALGDIEALAKQVCLIQQSLEPKLTKPTILVFAGDHGIAEEGVSAYPQEVTWQMVMNFVAGGAAINVFTRQNGMDLQVIDAGVNYEFPGDLPIVYRKIAKGTRNFLIDLAMTESQLNQSLQSGADVLGELHDKGCNVVGFGEMGIANTASAAALVSQLTGIPVSEITGRGTGLNDHQLSHKIQVLENAFTYHGEIDDVHAVLQTFGGFEIAQMVGAMLEARNRNVLILVDGFIASAAYLCAYKLDPSVKGNAVFCHCSQEQGHRKLLDYLGVNALLDLNLRLGEGSGCALAYPLVKAAVSFINEMASFEDAGVSDA